MNTTRCMIMAVGLCLGLCHAVPLPTTPVAESVTEVLLSQRFDSETAGREPMGWFAIRSGDGHCVVTHSYAASLAQSFRIGSSPIWDGLYGYGFGTPQGGVVRVETRILCDTIGAAKPYLGVKIGGQFYEMVSDPERAMTRWSNGEARWSCGPALVQGTWNTVRIDIDVTRGVARYWLNGAVVLDNCIGVPAPEFARITEAIYIGVVAGAAGAAYFDDVTICQLSQQSLPLINPALHVAPLAPPARMAWMKSPACQRCPHAAQCARSGRRVCEGEKRPGTMQPDDQGKKACGGPCTQGKPCTEKCLLQRGRQSCAGPCMQGKPCSKKCLRAQKKMKRANKQRLPVPPGPAPAW